ncbi:hypothetical protein Acr_01g0009440 [Actinidia rufa]|uniref:P-loop containing nucleoside triphosphate hydrolases superfamily protein n=1 Tax=Actinidia rufa TaxID=165716 RepID=A0A7J0E440_9ERIC|nr:hypothetical protein Acr_01g0009440 [Actinidia rufa]
MGIYQEWTRKRFTGSVIVAMKGPPCCGKSYTAQQIAKDLKYRIIEQDDCIEELQSAVKNSTTTTKNLEYLHALSRDIVLQIALKQLQLGHRVIIDTSLHLQSYLERLLQLSISIAARLVIVECIPQDRYVWQQRHQDRYQKEGSVWYRPTTQEDFSMVKTSYKEWSDDDIPGISKLVVDATHLYKDLEIAMAVKYLASIQASQRMSMHQWDNDIWLNDKSGFWKVGNREGEDAEEEEDEKDDEDFHHHHFVLVNDGNIDDDEITCRGCSEPISSSNSSPPYYKCSGSECSLSLHQACTELLNKEFPILQIYSFSREVSVQ